MIFVPRMYPNCSFCHLPQNDTIGDTIMRPITLYRSAAIWASFTGRPDLTPISEVSHTLLIAYNYLQSIPNNLATVKIDSETTVLSCGTRSCDVRRQ